MSKRTNILYSVQVARYAWITVEASSPHEAMEMASREDLDELLPDMAFEDSDTIVCACNSYSDGIGEMYIDDDEYVITKDGNMTAGEYRCALEENE